MKAGFLGITFVFFAALLLLVPAPAHTQSAETTIDGVTAEVVELHQAGGVLRLAIRFTNAGAKDAEPGRYGLERITLVDVKSKKKYFPLRDADKQYLAGPIGDRIDGGRIRLLVPSKQSAVLWAYFEPVTAGTVMNVEVPYAFPFENVPVTEAPSKVLASTTAKSNPSGASATVVSARRADQVLTVRLRLVPEPGVKVRVGPYFEYKEVSLFDSAAKRKYPLMKDTEGNFQAQPLTVKMDGGSFILNWNNPTLVSLTFQAPPDSVTKADLLLPGFLPVEGMVIEGLGGAAVGGSAAEGKSLGLEGALKELNAVVTPTQITIDLAADVLFDFDKATIKKEAEPSLQNLATVLKANPAAAVAIEGHTDAKGADAYNQTLSEQRAASVKEWLVANAQVSGAGIATRGWGKTKPVAPNTKPDGSDDPAGRTKNRRVQVIVRKGVGEDQRYQQQGVRAPAVATASGEPAVRPCEYIPGVTVPAVMPAAPSREQSPGIGASATPPVVTKVSAQKTASRLRILDGLSNAVRNDYIYTDFGVRDWNDIVESHKARISRGMSDDDFYAAMRSTVRALGDGHSFFLTPDEVKKYEEEVAGTRKFVGVGAYISPIERTDHATILSIYRDSPAAEAGLKPHDVMLSVDGQSYLDETGRPRTLGQPGSKVRLTMQRPGQPPRDVVLTRREVTGVLPIDFCVVPTTRIGYIFLPGLGDSTIADQVRGALQRMTADGPLEGLILDNRVNRGGLSLVMNAILSMFGSGVQGQYVSRRENRPMELNPEDIGGSQTMPLVVLIERPTASNGEIMSGLLSLSGRAKLVGSTTKGNVETLNWFQFEDGSRAWLAISTFAPRGMKNGAWEGKGVAPDVFLPTRWDLFTEATDPGIAKAVGLLRK